MSEQTKRCVTGADPDKRFPVPSDESFAGEEYRDAPELLTVAERLIDDLPEFAELAANRPSLRCVWKQKAKKKQGKTVLGLCNKLSGLTKYFGGCAWTIEVGADACRDLKVTHWQIEALLFHELNHIEVVIDEETGAVSHKVRGEDAYAFVAEIKRYGAWTDGLGAVADAWSQAPLFAPMTRSPRPSAGGVTATISVNGRTVDLDGPEAAEVVGSVVDAAIDGARRRAAVADRVNLVTADA